MIQTKEQAQIQLQNALTTTFLANLAFLSEYDNELYHRVDALSRMIENGTYKEKYALDFIMEDGDFDIYDIVNDKYLYDRKPKQKNDELVRKIQYDTSQSIFTFPEIFSLKTNSNIDDIKRFNFQNALESLILTQANSEEYTNILVDYLENKDKRFKKIKKFIFLGTLLGRHIPRLAKKINAQMYLVLERNLEIFRLSLFTVDYTVLANKGVIFSIMDKNSEEENKILRFLNIQNLDNYILKFSSTGINIDRYIDKILSLNESNRPTAYDYNRVLYVYANRTTNLLDQNYKILDFDKIKKECKEFENKKILYIAAGPSLDDNIEWIKEKQNKFFIVTIGAAYKKLISNNIRIDAILTLDESDILAKLQFDDIGVSKISKNTIIIASTITNSHVLDKFNKDNLFLFEIYYPLQKNNIVYSGFSIGEIGLSILLNLNPKDIYLIGLDLALNQKTGSTHSSSSNSITQIINIEENQNREEFDLHETTIKVKGNLKKEVFTNAFFYSSIKSAEGKLKSKNKLTKVYNLSKHGAYLKGTVPIKLSNIKDLEDNLYSSKEFKEYLNKNNFLKLSKVSQKDILKEINFLEKRIKPLLNGIERENFNTYYRFYRKILLITIKILDNKKSIFYEIITNYFQINIPYLTYHFNDKNIDNEKEKLESVKKIFIKHIRILLDDYIFILKRLV